MKKFLLIFALAIITLLSSCGASEVETRAQQQEVYEFYLDTKTTLFLTSISLAFCAGLATIPWHSPIRSLTVEQKALLGLTSLIGAPLFGYGFLYGLNNLLHSNKPYIYVTSKGIWCWDFGFIAWDKVKRVRLTLTAKQICIELTDTASSLYYYHPIYLINSELFITDILSVPLEECYRAIAHFYKQSLLHRPLLQKMQ